MLCTHRLVHSIDCSLEVESCPFGEGREWHTLTGSVSSPSLPPGKAVNSGWLMTSSVISPGSYIIYNATSGQNKFCIISHRIM